MRLSDTSLGNYYTTTVSSLIVSNAPNLRYLTCRNNQLTELDISNNTALSWLSCYNNAIPLADLYAASQQITPLSPLPVDNKRFGTQTLLKENVNVGVPVVVDSVFNGNNTSFMIKKDGSAATDNDYTRAGGRITFSQKGTYTVEMTNPAIQSASEYPAKVIATYVVLNAAATPSITAQPQSATYDVNAAATALSVTANVSDGGVLSYQWYSNTANSNAGGTPVGTNSSSYTPPTSTVGTLYYYVTVTNTNNHASNVKTATATSNAARITVSALVNAAAPVITAQPRDTTYNLSATAVALSVTANVTDGGTLSYQWYRNTANIHIGGTPVGTNASYTPPTSATGKLYYYVVVTNTNNSAAGVKKATARSKPATVTVNAAGLVNTATPAISAHP
jgi:hypothetical protein